MNSNPATVVKPRRIIGQGVPIYEEFTDDLDIPVSNLERQASGGSFELDDYRDGNMLS